MSPLVRDRLRGLFERHPALELTVAVAFMVLGVVVLLFMPEEEGRRLGIPMYVIGLVLIVLMLFPAAQAMKRLLGSREHD